ncbi:hypothetical protein AA105894_0207 [Asaia spathodeae NBRC 105894]|nr:hypothetical protein AA105894_0207 [Asaia spathodeae NBRC 105894]
MDTSPKPGHARCLGGSRHFMVRQESQSLESSSGSCRKVWSVMIEQGVAKHESEKVRVRVRKGDIGISYRVSRRRVLPPHLTTCLELVLMGYDVCALSRESEEGCSCSVSEAKRFTDATRLSESAHRLNMTPAETKKAAPKGGFLVTRD